MWGANAGTDIHAISDPFLNLTTRLREGEQHMVNFEDEGEYQGELFCSIP